MTFDGGVKTHRLTNLKKIFQNSFHNLEYVFHKTFLTKFQLFHQLFASLSRNDLLIFFSLGVVKIDKEKHRKHSKVSEKQVELRNLFFFNLLYHSIERPFEALLDESTLFYLFYGRKSEFLFNYQHTCSHSLFLNLINQLVGQFQALLVLSKS